MDGVSLESLIAKIETHEEILVQLILAAENTTQALSIIAEKLRELQST